MTLRLRVVQSEHRAVWENPYVLVANAVPTTTVLSAVETAVLEQYNEQTGCWDRVEVERVP